MVILSVLVERFSVSSMRDFLENVHPPPDVRCQVSVVRCQVSGITCNFLGGRGGGGQSGGSSRLRVC